MKYAQCFKEHILNTQTTIIEAVANIVKESHYRKYRPVTPSSIIDPTLPEIQYTLIAILAFIVTLVRFEVLMFYIKPLTVVD